LREVFLKQLSSSNLEKVNNIRELEEGRMYFIKLNHPGKPSYKYLGTYRTGRIKYIFFNIIKIKGEPGLSPNIWYDYDENPNMMFETRFFDDYYYIYKVPDFINNMGPYDNVNEIIRHEQARQERETRNTLSMLIGNRSSSDNLTPEAAPIGHIMSYLSRGKSLKPKLNRKSRRKSRSKRPLKYSL
jgi:hypothetical protein